MSAQGPELLRDYFLFDGPIMPSTVLMKTEAAKAVGGFNVDLLIFEDTDFFMRLAGAGYRFAHVAEGLTFKRLRGNSLSANIDAWEPAMLRETQMTVARHPELAPLARRRNSFRFAKIARAYFGRSQDRMGWNALGRALAMNPLNPRVYAYGGFAALSAMRRTGLAGRVRRTISVEPFR